MTPPFSSDQDTLDVHFVPVLKDNYAFIIRSFCGAVGVIDAGESVPIIERLEEIRESPSYIFITHHHWDHTDGLEALKQRYPECQVIVPDLEKHKIAVADGTLKDQDVFSFGAQRVRALSTPGHSVGSMCYYFEDSGVVFTGDTLFSLGCGRVFEGTPEQMYHSLQKLKALPDDTLVYCAHEYTRGAAGFCLSVDSHNQALLERIEQVKVLRENGLPSLPSTIGLEKKTNVFLRAKSAEEFARVRHKKDKF
ncbi:MAG: hydroxyacylglutathione hydrolase [Alphaproteobacteria bacterium]